jgi:hypothetical protein
VRASGACVRSAADRARESVYECVCVFVRACVFACVGGSYVFMTVSEWTRRRNWIEPRFSSRAPPRRVRKSMLASRVRPRLPWYVHMYVHFVCIVCTCTVYKYMYLYTVLAT